MAFQLDSNVYSKQKSLSDYMAVKDARDLQRAQAERSIEASDMAIDAAKQKQVKDKIGLILAQTTPENYAESKAAIEAVGFPIKLPDSFEASKPIRDAILTATGYKAKPSFAEQFMQPFSMMMGVQQPQEPAPTQAAAPITPQGSIKTNEVPQMDTNGQPMPQLNDILKEPVVAGAPNPPAVNPPEPTSVPVPQPLPTLQTPVPAPFKPANLLEATEASKARAKAAINEPVANRKRELDRQDAELRTVNDPSQNASNSNVFAMRMMETTNKLQNNDGTNIDTTLAGFADVAGREVPLVGNYLVSPEYQRAKNLADNWVTANLRKESGAAIPPEELKQEREKYFPVPGDTQETIAQKRELRAIAEEGMRQAAGSLWKYNKAKPTSTANTSGSSGGGAPAVGTVEDGYEFLGGDPSKPESWRAK